MVHLGKIPQKEEVDTTLIDAVNQAHLQIANEEDRFTTSIYGSKFAAADLPRYEIPV